MQGEGRRGLVQAGRVGGRSAGQPLGGQDGNGRGQEDEEHGDRHELLPDQPAAALEPPNPLTGSAHHGIVGAGYISDRRIRQHPPPAYIPRVRMKRTPSAGIR